MTFEQLLYAEVLSHHPSMQAAADILHISKSGLSLAIGQLEDELGLKIFERTSRGTVLTPEGLKALAAISSVLREKNCLLNTVSALAEPHKHEVVTIRYMNTMFKAFINPFLGAFQDKYPNVTFDIRRNEREPILQAIRSQQIDAGFIVMPLQLSELGEGVRFEQICSSRLDLVCSPENDLAGKQVITLDDLKQQRYCLFNDESHDYVFDQLQYMCGPLPLLLRTDDSWAMHETIRKKNAVCFSRVMLSQVSREDTFDDLCSIPINHLVDANSHMGWVTNTQKPISDAAAALISMITKEIKKDTGNAVS